MNLQFRIWLENDQGELVIGDGMLLLLTTIKRTGSINKAAQELNMSYRSAWNKLNKAEKRIGYQLVLRQSGGKDGGGTDLTPKGQELVDKFNRIHEKTNSQVKKIYEDIF